MKRTPALAAWSGVAAFLFLYFYYFSLVWRYAANVPLGDEWVFLDPSAFGPSPWAWLIRPHNEHPIVLTKIIAKILLHAGGWNLWLEQVITYVFFGLMLLAGAGVAKKALPELRWGAVLGFFLIFFTAEMNGMHATGFNTQFHGAILFKFLAVYLLLHPRRTWAKTAAGSASAGLSILSFGSGLPSVAAIYFIYLLRLLLGWPCAARAERKAGLAHLGLALAAPALVVSLLMDFTLSQPGARGAPPTERLFWERLPKILAWPFFNSYDAPVLPAYALFFFVLLLPLAIGFFRPGERRRPELWLLLAGIAGTLGECAAVTMGRGHAADWLKTGGRYCEFAYFLVPWSGMAWAYALRKSAVRPYVLGALWLCLAWQYRSAWRPESYTAYMAFLRTRSHCLRDYYRQGGNAYCPPLYPEPLASRLEKAKELDLSFYRAVLNDEVSAAR